MTPRAAFLRALPGHGFTPPDGAVPAGDAVAQFTADVRAFAAEFWALPPAERRARWESLSARAAGPAAARLGELRRSLDAVRDPAASEVTALAYELFVLPPRERAARRAHWLTTHRPAPPRATAAPANVTAARLEPQLFKWVAAGVRPERIERQTWVDLRDRRRARRRFIDRYVNPKLTGWSAFVILAGLSLLLRLVLPETPAPRPPAQVARPTGR
ncbi:MAG: hypothetical protein U0804_04425 [Gemmataceae bacterium]